VNITTRSHKHQAEQCRKGVTRTSDNFMINAYADQRDESKPTKWYAACMQLADGKRPNIKKLRSIYK
jgi:hypothetical protein